MIVLAIVLAYFLAGAGLCCYSWSDARDLREGASLWVVWLASMIVIACWLPLLFRRRGGASCQRR